MSFCVSGKRVRLPYHSSYFLERVKGQNFKAKIDRFPQIGHSYNFKGHLLKNLSDIKQV